MNESGGGGGGNICDNCEWRRRRWIIIIMRGNEFARLTSIECVRAGDRGGAAQVATGEEVEEREEED